MPAEESELLRAFREAFEEGNLAWNSGDVKRAYAALPDELEYRLSPTWPEARVLRSRDEVVAFFEDFQATFPDAQTASHEYIEAEEGTVIVGFRVTGSGRSSGAGAEMEIWQVWEVQTLDDGLTTTSVTEFNDRQEAMEAAGVKQPSGQGPG
ncbi:MAG: nuclear transport factor 2 family protein [Solirubrobacterales bacterium]